MLSMRQIRYALAVWQEGAFIKAAAKVNISQPSISEQISQLEAKVGFKIFSRTGHGVEITDLGLAFLTEAEEVYQNLMHLEGSAKHLRGSRERIFSIGMSSGVTPLVVPSLTKSLGGVWPKLRLEVTTTSTRRIYKKLQEEALEIGITVETSPRVLPPDLRAEKIASDTMVLIVPVGHRFAERALIRIEELDDEPMIMTELSVGYSEVIQSMFVAAGIRANIVVVCDNFATIVAMVESDAGIAIVPRQTIASENGNESAHRIIRLEPKRTVNVMMVSRVRKMTELAEQYARTIKIHLQSRFDVN